MDAMTHTLRNIFASALFAGILVPDAGAQVSYLERISCPQDPVRIVTDEPGKGGSGAKQAELSFTFDWDGGRIASQHTAAIVPVLVSEDGSRSFSFDPIFIDGRTRAKAVDRMEALSGIERPEGSIVLRPDRNGGTGAVEYVSRIQYDPAMLDGSIVFHETVSGCAGCIEGEDSLALDVLPRYVPEWRTRRIAPEPEPVKRRQESRVARLQYKWDRYDILPSLADNQAVLDTVTNSIALVKSCDFITITGIYVAGFTSPEGTYEYNMNLSSLRARTFADYISRNNDVDPSLLSVEWSGEDWEGLKEALTASDFMKKAIVAGVIDTYTEDRNECERQIQNILTEDEYRWLVKNIYPVLRHSTYRIEYEVRNFDLDEARKMIYERPQDLNLDEIFKVAGSYPEDSAKRADAMAVAMEYFPDSPAVLGNQALEALADGKPQKAVILLKNRIPETGASPTADEAELLNILGVAYACSEDYAVAKSFLSLASEAGNVNAGHNLIQLEGVMEQLPDSYFSEENEKDYN